MRRRNVESGLARVISTVLASTFLMPSGMVVVPAASLPPFTLNHISVGMPFFHAAWFCAAQAMVHSTSSAVTGFPSLQTAAGFSLKGYTVASGDTVHSVARSGRMVTSSLSTSTSVLKTMSAISSWLPVPRFTGWMLGRKSEIRATRSVVGPAADGAADGAADAAADGRGAPDAVLADGDAVVPPHATAISMTTASMAKKRALIGL